MIDTHCHLDHKQFDDDRAAATQRAFDAGLTHIVIPAIEPERFDGVLALAHSDSRIVCGMGIHPHNALAATEAALKRVEELSHDERVRAIGEIGLDYHYDFVPRDVQHTAFRAQLRIAKRRNLPVIVHNRESDDDMMDILNEEQDGSLRGVLHCFSGTPEMAERAVNLGFHVSFTGNITYKKSTLSETIAAVPMERIMIETDAPYMAPVPYRGKRNEPAFVRLVAEKIAEVREMTIEDVLATTTHTAKQFFALVSLILLLCGASIPTLAQTTNDEGEREVELPNPFPKKFGIGAIFGTNTLSDFTTTINSTPNDGSAIGPGASLVYYFSDHWAVNASYFRGVNTVVTRPDATTGLPRQEYPNIHQAFDLSLQWVANPANVLNFHFMLGASYVTNTFNAAPTNPGRGYFGFHVNIVGLSANIATPIGIFYPGLEYRANIVLGLNEQKNYDLGITRTLTGFVFSVPRATLYWFPNFSGR
jgi:TatD DNase family protein